MTPNIAQIIAAFCEVTHVPVREIIGPSKMGHIVKARHQAMYAARVLTGASYPIIAKAFNRRDHVGVMQACRKLAGDERYKRRLEQMRAAYGRRVAA